jgi:DNA polymerase-3 subunit epsilon
MKQIRIIGCDLETTGFKFESGHRITEFAFTIVDFDGKDFIKRKTFNRLVNPERGVPEIVQKITGITPTMLADKPTFAHFAPAISKLLSTADCFVAHNLDFDGPFLHYQITQLGLPFNMEMEDFCTMQAGRFSTGTGKVPKLSELCWALDVPFDSENAHRAAYDTENMMIAFEKAVSAGHFKPDCLQGYFGGDL